MKKVSESDWVWYGHAGHFILGRWCRFHMTTKVGRFLVSTVGELVHPRNSGGSERAESDWLAANAPGEDIGYTRKYETMVFVADGKECAAPGCNCGQPLFNPADIDLMPYNDARSARHGHMDLCRKWAGMQDWNGVEL